MLMTMISSNGFRSFLSGKLSDNSISYYLSYLRRCDSSKLTSLPIGQSLLSIICSKCNSTSSIEDRYNIVQSYITEISEILSKLDTSCTTQRKYFSDLRSVLRKFSDYVTSSNRSYPDLPITKSTSSNQKKVNRQIEQIDGMSILTDRFSEIKQFVEFVLSACYIFSVEDVILQHRKLIDNVLERKALLARLSSDKKLYGNREDVKRGSKNVIFNDGTSGDILINIDGNGNAAVDKLFVQKTGRYLKGNKSRNPDFINFTISHIWGKAFDPRYFTNLWNIVLVPSFANDILDKPASHDGSYYLGAVLLNTLKCILYKYYQMERLNWEDLRLNLPSYISEKVISGTYRINIFSSLGNTDEISEIKQIEISI